MSRTVPRNSALDNTKSADDTMPMPITLHPRNFIVSKARSGIIDALLTARAEHPELTIPEYLKILNEEVAFWIGAAIKDERKE